MYLVTVARLWDQILNVGVWWVCLLSSPAREHTTSISLGSEILLTGRCSRICSHICDISCSGRTRLSKLREPEPFPVKPIAVFNGAIWRYKCHPFRNQLLKCVEHNHNEWKPYCWKCSTVLSGSKEGFESRATIVLVRDTMNGLNCMSYESEDVCMSLDQVLWHATPLSCHHCQRNNDLVIARACVVIKMSQVVF